MTLDVTQDEQTPEQGSGLALAVVQCVFTLGWTIYALMLPGLLAQAGIAASWLPVILMLDQLIFAGMDIAFGVMADRMQGVYRRLAKLLLVMTSISALAFLLLPMAAKVSAVTLLCVLLFWVISASVVRAPTLVLLAKRAKAAQRPKLLIWYSAGMALAMAISPFIGLWLKRMDPYLPFTLSALTLLGAVYMLLRHIGTECPAEEMQAPQAAPFSSCLPLLASLGIAGLGFQLHAFVNAAPLYKLHAEAQDNLPWLMPLLWLGFFAMIVGLGTLIKRFSPMPVAATGIFIVALGSYAAPGAGTLTTLIGLQILCGAGWAMAFVGLMEQTSAAGTRGAEGLFMGSFFAVTALSAFARIAFAANWLSDWKESQFILPSILLLTAGIVAAVDARKWAKFKRAQSH